MLAYNDKFLWLGFKSPNINLVSNYIKESQWELFNGLISTHSSKIAALINLGNKQQMVFILLSEVWFTSHSSLSI